MTAKNRALKPLAQAQPESFTKIRVSIGVSWSFEAEGRESVVMDAYTRWIEAGRDIEMKRKPKDAL